jgi:hypothetical protein
MNAHFSTPDPRHLWGESATHPRGLFLNALARRKSSRYLWYREDLRLARAFKKSPLERVQLPNQG